jgi:hypothetical protein
VKNLTLLASIFVVVISCKNDKNTENSNTKNNENINLKSSESVEVQVENDFDKFIISIEAIVTKDDKFHLMYLTDDITSWSSKGLIKKEIKGQDVAQTIEFKLPKGNFPTKFRVDLGFNKEQKKIDLYKIKFQFEGNEIVVEENMIERSFIPNVYATYSKDNKADLVLSEEKGKYNPLIIATDHIMNRLNIKFKKQNL